jgi:hypothetical protein
MVSEKLAQMSLDLPNWWAQSRKEQRGADVVARLLQRACVLFNKIRDEGRIATLELPR